MKKKQTKLTTEIEKESSGSISVPLEAIDDLHEVVLGLDHYTDILAETGKREGEFFLLYPLIEKLRDVESMMGGLQKGGAR